VTLPRAAARPPGRAGIAGRRVTARDAIVASVLAAVVSGAPSTIVASATGDDPLRATRAAGSLLVRDGDGVALVAAGAVTHAAISLGWGTALAVLLPRRHTVAAGAVAGLAIAALDLGVIGRRFPAIRSLPSAPQLADHVAFGACVGAVLSARARRRRRR